MSDPQIDLQSRNPSGKSGGTGSIIFLFLFGLPFAGAGLLVAVLGIGKLMAGNSHDGVPLCLIGLLFSAVGFGLMFAAVYARKSAKQTAESQVRYPDKPWMLQPDWATGRVKSSGVGQAKMLAFMGIMFCGIGGLATALVLTKELPNRNYAALFVLIFPAVGLVLLAFVVRAALARRRFGDCFFEMAAVPGALGGTLEGIIQTGARLRLDHDLHLKLSCIRRVTTGSGKNSSTNDYILWQDEKILKAEADLPEPEPGHTGIPVFFKLPADQPESATGGGDGIHWQLEAKAKMTGVGFHAAFIVPVFQVAEAAEAEADEPDPTAALNAPMDEIRRDEHSNIEIADGPDTDEPDPTAGLQAPIEEIRRDEHSRIQVTDGPNGREFFFPAARNWGTATGLTIFLGGWTGAIWATIRFDAPLLFPIVFGFAEVVIFLLCFSLWFKSSRVTVDSMSVRATSRWLFFSRTRQFAASDVARFATKQGMQSGSRVFTNIKLITRRSDEQFAAEKEKFPGAFQNGGFPGPSGVTVASGIASAPEAKWLVQDMNKALGRT